MREAASLVPDARARRRCETSTISPSGRCLAPAPTRALTAQPAGDRARRQCLDDSKANVDVKKAKLDYDQANYEHSKRDWDRAQV